MSSDAQKRSVTSIIVYRDGEDVDNWGRDILEYSNYRDARWFRLSSRLRACGLHKKDLKGIIDSARLAEDATRTVSNVPFSVFWGQQLIIGWEAHGDDVKVYFLSSGTTGKWHVGKLFFADGGEQVFGMREGSLRAKMTYWRNWLLLVRVFPQLRHLELDGTNSDDSRARFSLAAELVHQVERNTQNHITAMKKKTIRELEMLDRED